MDCSMSPKIESGMLRLNRDSVQLGWSFSISW